jgi:hypothetical protein
MKSKTKIGSALFVLLGVLLVTAAMVEAQTPARFLGTVTAVNGTTLTVKTQERCTRLTCRPRPR